MAKNIMTFVVKTLVTAAVSIWAFLGFIGTPMDELHNIADLRVVSGSEIQDTHDEGYEDGYQIGYDAGFKAGRSSSQSQTASSSSSSFSSKTMYVADGGLRLRYGPGTNYDYDIELPLNQAVQVYTIENGWANVSANGHKGWCSVEYLSNSKLAAYSQPESSSQAGMTVWVSRTGSCYHSDPNCSNMQDPIAMSESEAREYGRTACSKCF